MNISQDIQKAVINNNVKELERIFYAVGGETFVLLINDLSYSKPLLHIAAKVGSASTTNFLLAHGADCTQVDSTGRTALHEAVTSGASDIASLIVKASLNHGNSDEADGLLINSLAYNSIASLAKTGSLINVKDNKGLSAWLLLSEVHLNLNEFDAMVEVMINNVKNINESHPGTGKTVLFRAVETNSINSCKLLTSSNAIDLGHGDYSGNTIYHLAAKFGFKEILEHILLCSNQYVNKKDNLGNTPLHYACSRGSRECLTLLLNYGGDLSQTNNEGVSVLDAIFCNLPRPTAYLSELFDSKISSNGLSINDRQFEITVDFSILFPNNQRQMAVVIALMNSLHFSERRNLLQHPLVETYLRFKWSRIRIFFFLLVLLHFAFVISLSVFVSIMVSPENDVELKWSRRVVLVTAIMLGCHIGLQTGLAPRYFLREPETWLGGTCILLSLIMSLCGEIIRLPEDDSSDWLRHLAAFTILLSWGHIMFILGRFPTVGFFALMFFTVLKNVVKVLLIFACLVIGFALSFCVQFNNFQYDGPWKAFIRTTVMLMGEYEYGALFRDEDKFPTRFIGKPSALGLSSQFIFLLFLLLGSIVLINLMVGLAVNDIQGLQVEGNLRQMMKQAEFILHMDRLLSHMKICESRKRIPRCVALNPSTMTRMWTNKYKGLWSQLPRRVLEHLISVAIKNCQGARERESLHIDENECLDT